jgi:hypothetical protein
MKVLEIFGADRPESDSLRMESNRRNVLQVQGHVSKASDPVL